MGLQPTGGTSATANETSCMNNSKLGRLLMDGKVVGTMYEDGIMRYKLTPMGRVNAAAEMVNYINGMCVSPMRSTTAMIDPDVTRH